MEEIQGIREDICVKAPELTEIKSLQMFEAGGFLRSEILILLFKEESMLSVPVGRGA